MINSLGLILASFTAPENIGMDPKSVLWMFPLAAAIASIYKVNKMKNLTFQSFAKEAAVLFVSIAGFIVVAAIALSVISYLATE